MPCSDDSADQPTRPSGSSICHHRYAPVQYGTHSGPPITLTCVPRIFVRIQLSLIPGEERKFKRRKIIAISPIFRCERARAALQATASDAAVPGVVVAWGAGVAVGRGRGVAVGSERLVSVGEGIGNAVAVEGGEVEVGRGVALGSEVFAPMGEAVAVSGGEVGEAGPAVGLGRNATEGVIRSDVEDWGGDAHIRIKARISRKTATISLKRS